MNNEQAITKARYRFYGSLNIFLRENKRYRCFVHRVKGRPAIKDTLESLGVVHPEIDSILANGKSVSFTYKVNDGDLICVYPLNFKLNKRKLKHLQPKIPNPAKFVIDSHVGKLARHMRLLGFDSVYKRNFPDAHIVQTAIKEKRIVLTRDIGLLKNKRVQHGYWLRTTDPQRQIIEVLKFFRIFSKIKPFKLCLECNGNIKRITKSRVLRKLPPKVKKYYSQFYVCKGCHKIYWKGSHYEVLLKLVNRIVS